jgi:cytochrome c oxidase assembly protein subunit 11
MTRLRLERERFERETRQRNQAVAFRMGAIVLLTLGLSYAFVPLYQMFCQATGYGGTTQSGKSSEDVLTQANKPGVGSRNMTVYFNADVSKNLAWKFEPSQNSVQCKTGEPVLAFFRSTLRVIEVCVCVCDVCSAQSNQLD